MKLVDDDLCTFCKSSPEDISHVYYDCPCTQEFWQKLEDFLYQKLHNDLTLSKFVIMFGTLSSDHLVNHILFLAKRFFFYLQSETKGYSL